ncbi:flagellar motor switch protein FliY [Treponema primitia ZAS-2]|uniref:Flagellar motor switch protein FliN n=1 Tax=Treponema primitia (strain ATCC BAA-887 / DSM 12427 / ZAS-2) TaxID=545694 RepID=F5YPU0_TREPZ|nr:flagellar motor switch protein FliN [Treponema primitia]AEF84769.1 flagellar motor switch protein FliY [Treponema primitia ZAS-2]
MSDGALSQDEIDALLSGVDSSGPGDIPGNGNGDAESKALQGYLSGTVDAQSSNLSTMTGATVSLKGPTVSASTRDSLVEKLPDMVTAVKADFSGGFPGEHVFLFSEDAAKAIAALMNKEENIELDEMAMSVIGEMVGTLVGTQITTLTGKTGNKSIANVAPEAANVPKATAALPAGEFQVADYQLDLGDGKAYQVWEVYGPQVSADITRALSGPPPAAPGAASQAARPANGGSAMGGMFGGAAMGGGGMGAMMGSPTNVQSVQFPNLMPSPTAQEQGNIGLIMDVYMEMTVELGRTRKLIKEILGMGEGTIIELDKLAGEPVDILVNHKLIAKGEVVVIDENFGVRVTEIVSPMERMSELS